MKTKYLLLAGLIVVLGSCSTAYRSGQTPDDVYYSPEPAAKETYIVANNSDRQSYATRNAEEREIRRAIRNPRYRSSISLNLGYGMGYGMGYGYNPYSFNPYGFNSFGYSPFYDPYYSSFGKGFYDPFGYNPYYSFGYNPYYSFGYNPYYGGLFSPYYGGHFGGGHFGSYYPPAYYPVAPGKTANPNTGARRYNLTNYGNSTTTPRIQNNRTGVTPNAPNRVPVRTFSNPNTTTESNTTTERRTGVGNVIRRVFTPTENNTYRAPENNSNNRRYTPPSNNRSNNDYRPTNTTPTRTFERSSTPPVRSTPPPTNNNSRTPVRTFRNN